MSIKTIGLSVVGCLMLMSSAALAADKSVPKMSGSAGAIASRAAAKSITICWGQYKTLAACNQAWAGAGTFTTFSCANTCAQNNYSQYFPCRPPTGGVDNAYLCQAVCGKPLNQGCTVAGGPVLPGNQCGYAWPTVTCQ
jgi:hypothetical protein